MLNLQTLSQTETIDTEALRQFFFEELGTEVDVVYLVEKLIDMFGGEKLPYDSGCQTRRKTR